YEPDPLDCTRCRGVMRVVAFITEGRVIRRILDPLCGAKRPQRALRKPSPRGAAPLRCRPPRPLEPVPTVNRTAAENQSSYHLINASASSPGPPGVLILEWAANPVPAARGGDGVRQEEILKAGRPQGPLAGFKETIYGISAHDMSRAALRTRASIEHLSV